MNEITDNHDVILRALSTEDLRDVHRIEVAASPDPWSASLFADELSGTGADRQWLVALSDVTSGGDSPGQLVGFGGLLFVADEAHVMNLAVDPARQRQGIAAQLLSRLLLDAGDRGAIGATLEVRASNAPALGLYERFGFVEAGRRPHYYPDGEEAVIMWAHKIYRPEYRRQLVDFMSPGNPGDAHDHQR